MEEQQAGLLDKESLDKLYADFEEKAKRHGFLLNFEYQKGGTALEESRTESGLLQKEMLNMAAGTLFRLDASQRVGFMNKVSSSYARPINSRVGVMAVEAFYKSTLFNVLDLMDQSSHKDKE